VVALKSLVRYLRFLLPDAGALAAMLASLVAATVAGLAIPWLTGLAVTEVRAAGGPPPALSALGRWATVGRHGLAALPWLALEIVLAAAVSGALTFARGYLSEWIAQRSMFRARAALYEHLQRQSFSYFDQSDTGQLMSRATGDVETLRRLISRAGPGALTALVQFVGTAVILFRLDARLSLLVLAIAPFFVWTVLAMSRRLRAASWALQQQLADLTSVLQEDVAAIRVVRAFARGEYERARFRRENEGYFARSMDVARIQARYQPVLGQLPTLGTVLLLGYGGLQVIAHRLPLGTFVAFNSYVLMLLGPLRMIALVVNLGAQAAASADRIFQILDSGGDVRPPAHPVVLPRLRGEVAFEGVGVRYPGQTAWALRGVDLRVAPGECVALVGTTGSGKSTLVQLVPRFYDATEGRVLVDGHDVRTLDLKTLRRQIGFVPQDPFLFSATIEDNIRYGRPDASREVVRRAAEAAHIADFIESLPQGYDTWVGERGVGLSGGQRQRVAIARALVMDPRILILDDATSSVDAENEYLIWEALKNLMRGRTTFLIAHRLASVLHADRIVVLGDGEVLAVGRHAELLATSPAYRHVYELQLAPRERPAAVGSPLG
jgi:ABC-type multidrug transport system fused ATPase/permease subunit